MGSKLLVRTLPVSLLAFAFLLGQSFHVTKGFKQSLKLYFGSNTDGDFLDIETNHPNLNDYTALLPKVQYACGIGSWFAFSAENYLGTFTKVGGECSNRSYCGGFSTTNTKSIRHLGFSLSETLSNGLSLYGGDAYRGAEILVEGSAFAGITTPVKSIVGTGTGSTEWKLFEGQHLEGKSVCIKVPRQGCNIYWEDNVSYIHLTTIGSVFKGCNILEIEEYKRQNII